MFPRKPGTAALRAVNLAERQGQIRYALAAYRQHAKTLGISVKKRAILCFFNAAGSDAPAVLKPGCQQTAAGRAQNLRRIGRRPKQIPGAVSHGAIAPYQSVPVFIAGGIHLHSAVSCRVQPKRQRQRGVSVLQFFELLFSAVTDRKADAAESRRYRQQQAQQRRTPKASEGKLAENMHFFSPPHFT